MCLDVNRVHCMIRIFLRHDIALFSDTLGMFGTTPVRQMLDIRNEPGTNLSL